ncbi:uncharacterized protein IL334_003017 [Kwoniella shivajii]|uniref:Non-haem dioxygenase N-terminal domain-containing protein n=1 Tax=Kwoniella shivajii TaxID=564305 RepID=A0ABZ1CY20_9TREE|nr:hypothetical protein IL334_003017 [Kwoniella shivajii]
MPIAIPAAVHTPHPNDKYQNVSTAVTNLPVIDFDGFEDGNGPRAQEIAEQFYAACRDVGFAYIRNFGMDLELVDEMFGWSKKFFDLSKEVKLKAPHPAAGWHHRGYSAVGRSIAVQLMKQLWQHSRSYEYGNKEHTRLTNILIPDEDLPGYNAALERYFQAGTACSKVLLKALALAMPGVPAGFLEEYHAWGDNQVRLLHYPPQSTTALRNGEVGRIGEHTDYGSGTILFQDGTGGLEVEDPNKPGTFLQAKPIPGYAVFNIGEYIPTNF